MRILAIGDPHGNLKMIRKIPIKGIDLILLTGDLGKVDLMRKMAFENIQRMKIGLPGKEYSLYQKKRAYMEAYNSAMSVVKYLAKYASVFTIYGNGDSRNWEARREGKAIGMKFPYLTDDLNRIEGVSVINNRLRNFNGVRIGGLDYFIDVSWVREFKPSNYNERLNVAFKDTKKARNVLKYFGKLDILVCHQPPYGILDKVTFKFAPRHWRGKHAGSKAILDYIKKENQKYVFCGHIHEGEGCRKIGKTEVYNLGVCGYKVVEI